MSNDIFPAELVIKSLRDSGYRNAAYALAELVDNSVQASATVIDIYLCEELTTSGKRNLKNIFVADNGKGMNKDELVSALRFGDGTRLKKEEWTGIGKFGMGLPSASISQCKNVRIWSRKKGADGILSTYLDIEEVRSGSLRSIPVPTVVPLPKFMPPTELLSKNGTIVLWSELDKCTWKTAKALHTNSAFLLGRIYRYFLDKGNIKINFVYFDLDEKKETKREALVKNDPMYLMSNTICPAPYQDKPMFKIWEGKDGDARGVKEYEIDVAGKSAKVKLRFSIAKDEARNIEGEGNAGSTEYGKAARKNQGVSLVRNDRELEMDTSVVHSTETTERWWGVEVLFDAALDEVFGVTNNKQHARHFSEMESHRYVDLIDTYNSVDKAEEEMKSQGDPTWVLLRVCHDIRSGLDQIRRDLKNQTHGKRSLSGKKPEAQLDKSELTLTNRTEKRAEVKEGSTDKDTSLAVAQKISAVEKVLADTGHDKKTASDLARAIVASGTRYNFEERDLSSPAFFDVRGGGSINLITINTAHEFYKSLYSQIMDKSVFEGNLEKMRDSLELAGFALKIIIGSWARMEDEANERVKSQLQDIRFDWGKLTRDFLRQDD